MKSAPKFKTIEEYIKSLPKESQSKVREMRSIARKLIPKGKESIKYGMPTIELNGKNFIHFAGMKEHLGFYPTPSGVKPFESELRKRGIDFSKGCIRFKYENPIPVPLITKIIKLRLKEEK